MRLALVAATLLLCGSRLAAAESAQCDATAFTLGKPATSAHKAQPAATGTSHALAQPVKKATPKPKPKPRLLASCKDAKAKKKNS